MTRQEIRAAIDDLHSVNTAGFHSGQLALINRALGLFYEAFAQATLTDHDIDVDLSNLCGFQKYASVAPAIAVWPVRSPVPSPAPSFAGIAA